jgi:hypothetical protein
MVEFLPTKRVFRGKYLEIEYRLRAINEFFSFK